MDGGPTSKRLKLLLVARERDTQVSLLGQGDNQMVIIKVPPQEELDRLGMNKEEYIVDFKEAMSEMATRCGLVIKADESWHSDHLIEYSRAYYFKGIQVSSNIEEGIKNTQRGKPNCADIQQDNLRGNVGRCLCCW